MAVSLQGVESGLVLQRFETLLGIQKTSLGVRVIGLMIVVTIQGKVMKGDV